MNISEFKRHYETETRNRISNTGRCRCPAHEDRTASLSVKEGDDGRILLRCHARCETEDVVKALGLTMADLMGDSNRNCAAPSATGKGGNKVHQDLDAARKAGLWSIQQQCNPGAVLGPVWKYHNTSGEDYAAVARFNLDTPAGEKQRKEFRPFRKVSGGWQCGDPARWEPYRIEKIGQAENVCLVEGEKCADILAGIGFGTVTSAHGAKAAEKTCWGALKDQKAVYLFPDNDDAGEQYIAAAARALRRDGFHGEFRKVILPGLPEHGDLADWRAVTSEDESAESTRAALDKIISEAPVYEPPPAPPGDDAPVLEADKKERNGNKKSGTAEALVALAEEHEFFHDADNAGYVCLECENSKGGPAGGHRENWLVDSKQYKRILAGRYYQAHKRAPDDSAVTNAVNTLDHKALDGETRIVGVRRIHHDGKIYLDLADVAWTVLEIDSEGWRLCPDPPVRFLRKNGMLPLPMPEAGGNIDALRELLNAPDDNAWILIKAFLLSTFNGDMPLPILAVNGEQGSAKSTLCRMLRMLIDPNKAPLRTFPKDEQDLTISAKNNLILAFDNLSGLPPAMTDALCRISTGSGYATRTLYSNSEETIFAGKRSIIINGIEDLTGRADLLDRCITIQLPAIPDDKRKNEADLWVEFERRRPQLLGALLDSVSAALKASPTVKIEKPPRMADFTHWAVAGETALAISPGGFLAAYRENIGAGNELVLESSLIFEPLKKLLEQHADEPWEGTARDLLEKLAVNAGYKDSNGAELQKPPKEWPANPRALRGKLTRLAPNLRKAGIDVTWPQRKNKARLITLSLLSSSNLKKRPSLPSLPSPNHQKSGILDGFSENSRPSPTVTTVTKPSPGGVEPPGRPSPQQGLPSPTVTENNIKKPDFSPVSDGGDGDDGIAGTSYPEGVSKRCEGVI